MTELRVAGVPEHFNLPWLLCLERKLFSEAGINLVWTDVPEGTGKLCQMLRSGEVDLAVVLTEGILKDIASGNPSKIIQVYVDSPLLWGIHVAANSKFEKIDQLEKAKVAISRFGSGSHLMAMVHAKKQGWQTNSIRFEVVDTIDGAVSALSEGRADYFMWEHFMTKPLVDCGVFRRLDDCPTPWPCFVIVATDEALDKKSDAVIKALKIINNYTAVFKQSADIEAVISERYALQKNDVMEWLSLTSWSQNQITEEVLNQVQNHLGELGLINKKGTFAEIVKTL